MTPFPQNGPVPSSPASPQKQVAEPEILVLRGRNLANQLAPWLVFWDDLAANSCEENVFYESWMFLPALQAFGACENLEIHLVFAPEHGPKSKKPLLCGFFPLVRSRRFKGMRARVLTLWKHVYCLLCTPLLRHEYEKAVLQAMLENCAKSRNRNDILVWNSVPAEGVFWQNLLEVLNARQSAVFADEIWNRALLRPAPNGQSDEYLNAALSTKKRKELRRQENRLGENGALRYVALASNNESEFERWIGDFLRLEASGWKGKAGSAFACDAVHERFFRAMARGAYEKNRLVLSALQIDERPIALTCDLLAGAGAFAFKIAFDEEYARFSPGVLLEIENIRQAHRDPRLEWMDSCAVSGHSMINHLWQERRILQNINIAASHGRGAWIVSFLPILRCAKRALSQVRAPLKKS